MSVLRPNANNMATVPDIRKFILIVVKPFRCPANKVIRLAVHVLVKYHRVFHPFIQTEKIRTIEKITTIERKHRKT